MSGKQEDETRRFRDEQQKKTEKSVGPALEFVRNRRRHREHGLDARRQEQKEQRSLKEGERSDVFLDLSSTRPFLRNGTGGEEHSRE
jgi:hypothetical protein